MKTKKRNDFYSTVNSKWLETQKLPKYHAVINSFESLNSKVQKQLNDLFYDLLIHHKDTNALFNSFKQKNDELAIMRIKQTSQFPVNDVGNVLKVSFLYEIPFLLSMSIITDPKTPSRSIVAISQCPLSFSDTDIYFHPAMKSSQNVWKHFETMCSRLFHVVFGNNHPYEVNDIVLVEKHLSQYINKQTSNHIEDFYNAYTVNKMKTEFGFDYSELTNILTMTPENVIVENPKYLKEVVRMLSSPSWKSKLQTYFVFKIMFSYAFFHKSLRKLHFQFFKHFLAGVKQEEPLKTECISLLNATFLNIEISKLYLQKYENRKEIQYCQHMIDKLQAKLIKRIADNKYLHKDTIQYAIKKIKKINFVVGHSHSFEMSFLDYITKNNITISSTDPFYNLDLYMKFRNTKSIDKLKKNSINKRNQWCSETCGNVYDINAYYSEATNSIIIPNGILQVPFVDVSKSIAYNLAYIGSTIGHEMFHAIDDEGCKFDIMGNYKNWWKATDKKVYEQKQKEIIRFYNNYARRNDDISVSSERTLGENISDIGGFLISEDVLKDELASKDDAEVKKEFKLFFISYAKQWRNKMTKQEKKRRLMFDYHSLAKYRANCVVLYSQKFQELFRNSNMNNSVQPSSFFWD
jgi:putative endopeptidase